MNIVLLLFLGGVVTLVKGTCVPGSTALNDYGDVVLCPISPGFSCYCGESELERSVRLAISNLRFMQTEIELLQSQANSRDSQLAQIRDSFASVSITPLDEVRITAPSVAFATGSQNVNVTLTAFNWDVSNPFIYLGDTLVLRWDLLHELQVQDSSENPVLTSEYTDLGELHFKPSNAGIYYVQCQRGHSCATSIVTVLAPQVLAGKLQPASENIKKIAASALLVNSSIAQIKSRLEGVSGLRPCSPGSIEVSPPTPTSYRNCSRLVSLANTNGFEVDLFTDVTGSVTLASTTLTSLTFRHLRFVSQNLLLTNNPTLTSISLLGLASSGSVEISSCPALQTFSAPLLASIPVGGLTFRFNNVITSISLPALTLITGSLSLVSNFALTSLQLSSLATVKGSFVFCDNTVFTIPSSVRAIWKSHTCFMSPGSTCLTLKSDCPPS